MFDSIELSIAGAMMRILFFFLMCLMLLFVAVQYNDPDGLMWMGIYAVPALWCGLATFWPRALDYAVSRMTLLVSIAAALAGVVRFWPLTPRFWTKEIWYNVETAREGMGLMIVTLVLLVVYYQVRRRRSLASTSPINANTNPTGCRTPSASP